jgi:hypothetical protein
MARIDIDRGRVASAGRESRCQRFVLTLENRDALGLRAQPQGVSRCQTALPVTS